MKSQKTHPNSKPSAEAQLQANAKEMEDLRRLGHIEMDAQLCTEMVQQFARLAIPTSKGYRHLLDLCWQPINPLFSKSHSMVKSSQVFPVIKGH